MIRTLSLCPVCYKKITAEIRFEGGSAVMHKTCDVHGSFSSTVDKDAQHVSNFYHMGTQGRNNNIIIHINDSCNMTCSWCYYKEGEYKTQPGMEYYDNILHQYQRQGFNLLLSGGEPTMRPDFFQFLDDAARLGWHCTTITNMIKLADDEFFDQAILHNHSQRLFDYALSFQHPKNYSKEIFEKKLKVMEKLSAHGIKAQCCAFSIQSLDELDYIREFWDRYKDNFLMLRVRTLFRNWGNKECDDHIYLSELHKAFLEKFSDMQPRISDAIETSNIYCLYLQTDGGHHISLSSAPTVDNLDYHICSRPVYMLGLDGRCYPVPIAQIVAEGIDKGWKDGLKLQTGGWKCSQ